MTKIILVSFMAVVAICCSKDKGTRIIMLNSEEGRKLTSAADSVYYEQEKKRFPSSTYDLLPIDSDALIASTRFEEIVVTSNAGCTWTSLSSPGTISKLTIDDRKQIWGLYSWRGIHEGDRSVLYSSNDLGRTWQAHEVDTKEIFPADFYSRPRSQLKIIDYEGKIYELKKGNQELEWHLVDSLNDGRVLNPWLGRKFVIDSKKRRWTFDEEGIFLIEKDTVKMY